MMLLLAFLVSFFLVIIGQSPVYFDPTLEEIERGVNIRPIATFGKQIRATKTIRLLVLGGSVSYRNPGGRGYVALLDAYLKRNVSAGSYAVNGAESGQGPEHFIGKKFDCESWECNKWPNL